MKRLGLGALAVLATGTMPAAADAALNLTLSFAQPTGTATTTDAIPVYLNVTLASDSASGTGYLSNTAALTAEYGDLLASQGMDVGNGVFFTLGSYLDCTSGGFGVCGGGAYLFNVSLVDNPFDGLSAGETGTILFGTLTPRGGEAPAGDYTLAGVGYELDAWGVDADFNPVQVTLATWSTPFGGTFTRTVEAAAAPAPGAVPEPATWAMMIAGFGLVGAGLRRRKGATRFA